ncbi:MAG TPA: LPS biosynthesis protein WbpP [Acidobacteria bacterium]|nr:LPS biosynthesis protein WbpP [Acidobacteriota bacterium]
MAIYLVTGGAGFIGSHVCEELVSRGEQVRVVDDLTTGRRENLAHLDGVALIIGDLTDPEVADRASTGVDYVVHLAAIPSVPGSIKDPLGSNHANVTGTLSLLVAARSQGVKRVVFASSSSVYGDTAHLPKREDMLPDPLSPYALQKLTGERYLKLFYDLHGLETVSVRYFNVFGPRQHPASSYSGVISLFARCLVEDRPPTIYGDGEQTRDFTYVRNVVDGTLRACVVPNAVGQVINVSCGGRVSLNTVFHTMRAMSDSTVVPEYTDPRVGDVRDSQGDITRARELLQYEPAVFLEEGLEATMAWFRAQPCQPTA